MYLSLPFSIQESGEIKKVSDIKESIRSFINLICSTPQGASVVDPEFGFVFDNYRFEKINENTNMLFSADPNGDKSDPHNHRITNANTNNDSFANDLIKSIQQFEPRLENISVDMKYQKEIKSVLLDISGQVQGVLDDKEKIFKHQVIIHIW